MALGQAGARGSAITLGAQGIRFVAQIASIAVLARILPPSDFGLIALVIAVISAGELFRDFGLSTAAIQAESLAAEEKTSLFWLNVLIAFVLAVVVIITAPLASHLFQEPQLSELLPVTAAAFLINGVQAQFRVELVRALRFASIALTELAGHLLGIVIAIPLALSGFGVWALVGQQLTAATVMCVARICLVSWRPRVVFSFGPARRFLRTGSHLLASLLLGFAATNADTVTIGLRLDAGQLGLYSRAYQLVAAPVGQLLSPLTNVGLPLLTRVRADGDKYSRYIFAMFLPLAYGSAFLFSFVIASSDALVAILLGDGWEASSTILAVLAAGGVFQFMNHVGYWVFVSAGHAAAMIRYSLVTHSLSVLLIVAGSLFGVMGVALGYSIGLALTWPIQVWWLRRLVRIPAAEIIAAGIRVIIFAGLCSTAGRFSSGFVNEPVLQCVSVLGSLFGVALIVLLLSPYRRDFGSLRHSISLVRRQR